MSKTRSPLPPRATQALANRDARLALGELRDGRILVAEARSPHRNGAIITYPWGGIHSSTRPAPSVRLSST